jgi:hypothetical protein
VEQATYGASQKEEKETERPVSTTIPRRMRFSKEAQSKQPSSRNPVQETQFKKPNTKKLRATDVPKTANGEFVVKRSRLAPKVAQVCYIVQRSLRRSL